MRNNERPETQKLLRPETQVTLPLKIQVTLPLGANAKLGCRTKATLASGDQVNLLRGVDVTLTLETQAMLLRMNQATLLLGIEGIEGIEAILPRSTQVLLVSGAQATLLDQGLSKDSGIQVILPPGTQAILLDQGLPKDFGIQAILPPETQAILPPGTQTLPLPPVCAKLLTEKPLGIQAILLPGTQATLPFETKVTKVAEPEPQKYHEQCNQFCNSLKENKIKTAIEHNLQIPSYFRTDDLYKAFDENTTLTKLSLWGGNIRGKIINGLLPYLEKHSNHKELRELCLFYLPFIYLEDVARLLTLNLDRLELQGTLILYEHEIEKDKDDNDNDKVFSEFINQLECTKIKYLNFCHVGFDKEELDQIVKVLYDNPNPVNIKIYARFDATFDEKFLKYKEVFRNHNRSCCGEKKLFELQEEADKIYQIRGCVSPEEVCKVFKYRHVTRQLASWLSCFKDPGGGGLQKKFGKGSDSQYEKNEDIYLVYDESHKYQIMIPYENIRELISALLEYAIIMDDEEGVEKNLILMLFFSLYIMLHNDYDFTNVSHKVRSNNQTLLDYRPGAGQKSLREIFINVRQNGEEQELCNYLPVLDDFKSIHETVSNPSLPSLARLKFKKVPRNDNCLFNAITGGGIVEDVDSLRKKVAIYMDREENFNKLKHYWPGSDEEFRKHICAIYKGTARGGDMEIKIIQCMIPRPIVIIRSDANPTIVVDDDDIKDQYNEENPIFIYYDAARKHYDAFTYDRSFVKSNGETVLNNIKKWLEKGEHIKYSPITQFNELSHDFTNKQDDESSIDSEDDDNYRFEVIADRTPQPSDEEREQIKALNDVKQRERVSYADYPRINVAFYRGVHFLTNRMNGEQRKRFRQRDDKYRPLVSSSVYDATKLTPMESSKCDDATLVREGQKQRCIIQELKKPQKTLHLNLSLPRKKPFTTPYSALQQAYTNSYGGLHKRLCEGKKRQRQLSTLFGGEPDTDEPIPIPFPFDKLESDCPPLVSTSHLPNHAIKYALGQKAFGKGNIPLKPGYRRSSGKPKHPYLGKIYIIILSAPELMDINPAFVLRMHKKREIDANTFYGKNVLSEGEVSFPALIEGEHVKLQKTIRVPSFSGEYKDYYQSKYGLSEMIYSNFKGEIRKSRNQSEARDTVLEKLYTTLISHFSKQLIQEAKARARPSLLLYQGLNGEFLFNAPDWKEAKNRDVDEIDEISEKVKGLLH